VAQRLAGVFYRIPGVGYKVGVKRPTATQSMGKILCGEMSYGDVAGRALKRLSSTLVPVLGQGSLNAEEKDLAPPALSRIVYLLLYSSVKI